MEIQLAERLKKLPPYLFADLRRKMAAARERGIKVIRIDIGDPDRSTPDGIVQEMVRALTDPKDPSRHRYGCDVPAVEFAQAVADFYRRRYGVQLEGENIVTTMGSKDAIVKFCMGLLNPGDMAIAPMPGYPTYNIGHVFAGAVTYQTPLLKENRYLVDFDAIPDEVRRQAKILWLNYPNNPTTATADLDFFRRAVEFGRQHNILIAHDSAYSENSYEGYQAPSILQVEGAQDVAVEFFSLSKAFSMTGWRAGAVVGHPGAVKALNTVQENVDNGQLRPVQFAAAYALNHYEQIVPEINAVYQRRRDLVVDTLNSKGWSLEKPKATIYIWAPVPERYNGSSSAFVADLLEKTGVMVTPGRGYGQWGEGHFRISLTYSDDTLREAMERIAQMRI